MQQFKVQWQKATKALAIPSIWIGLISYSLGVTTAKANDIEFLTSNSLGFSADAALIRGELKLVDRCFRIVDEFDNGYTVVWPKAVRYRKSGDMIEFVYKGKVFARIGETVKFGGGIDSFKDKKKMGKYINDPNSEKVEPKPKRF